MNNLLSYFRYASRQFRSSPVFTAAAVITLALGIGGTTAIFSLMHAVMLRSLPVADPSSLYRIGETNDCCVQGGPQDNWGMYSYPLYERLKANLPEFEQVAAFQAGPNRMSARRQSEQVAVALRSEYVTGNYFQTFGIQPFGGRLFSDDDDKVGSTPTVVLSYRVWQQQYGGDRNIVGSTLVLEGKPFTVIGIAPPGFFGETLRANPPDLWIPLQQERVISQKNSLLNTGFASWLRVIGRVKPGASVAGVGPRLTTVLRQWLANDAGFPAAWQSEVQRLLPKQVINVIPAGSGVAEMKEGYGRSLQILLGVCGLVLLIACANVANLLLARSAARRSQTAVRLAVGASRKQIIAQALAESVLLAVLGGVAGIIVALGATRLLLHLTFRFATMLPVSMMPSLPMLAFAFGLALLTGIIFGTAPAWFATHTHPIEALRGTRTSTDRASFVRKALLIAQATVSVVLVAGAMMLARSLSKLENQDFGYQVENRINVTLNSPSQNYNRERLNALYREMETRLKQLPGVQRVGLALYTPLTDNWGEQIQVQGHERTELGPETNSSWDRVSAGYLPAVGQPIVRGRNFTEADNENSDSVAIVNETFAKRFFPNEDALDKHFGLDLAEYSGTFRVVGVVKDGKYIDPQQPPRPMFFAPLAQSAKYNHPIMSQIDDRSHYIGGIALESSMPAGQLEPQLRRTLAELDPDLTVIRVLSMREQIAYEFDQQRAVAGLAALFGVVALLLAAVGLYGVTSYTVAQRTSEIGVRMALGADRSRIVGFVMRGAFRRVAIGLLIGIPLAIGAGRLISAQLYGIKAWDPFALSVAAIALGTCAFVAAMIPASRASKIDPMKVLRSE